MPVTCYLNFLQAEPVLLLTNLFPNPVNTNIPYLFFQQDGAPSPLGDPVIEYFLPVKALTRQKLLLPSYEHLRDGAVAVPRERKLPKKYKEFTK